MDFFCGCRSVTHKSFAQPTNLDIGETMHPILARVTGFLGASGIGLNIFWMSRQSDVDSHAFFLIFLGSCKYLAVCLRTLGII